MEEGNTTSIPTAADTEGGTGTGTLKDIDDDVCVFKPRGGGRLKGILKKQKIASGELGVQKSELEIYLEEATHDEDPDFDILQWWKLNSMRFPILAQMAQDVLAIPISTVASECTFSTGRQIIDPFQSSLTPKVAEALICARDWLRPPDHPISIEKNVDDLEKFEAEMLNFGDNYGGTIASLV